VISAEYCQLLARYGRWMNERMTAALATMPDEQRKLDRGAFFGSIHRTLSHLVWADSIWLARFTGTSYTEKAFGADLFGDFAALVRERESIDTRILRWAGTVDAAWLASTLEYRASSDGRLRRLPAWAAAVHLFQHAAHHRGQLTTLMKQSGLDPGATDLPFMPGVTQVSDR
jgi:uncharacterized damage-inducible protein DinB